MTRGPLGNVYTQTKPVLKNSSFFRQGEHCKAARPTLPRSPPLVIVDLSSWKLTHIFQLSDQCGKKGIWTDFCKFPPDFRKGKGQLWSMEVAEPHTVGLKLPTSGWVFSLAWQVQPEVLQVENGALQEAKGNVSDSCCAQWTAQESTVGSRWAAGKLTWASCPQGIRKAQEARPAEKPLALVGGVQVKE